MRAALRKLARSLSPPELAGRAYPLYERFRPEVPEGEAGWGAKGLLDLDRVADLAAEARHTEAATRPARARKARAR